LAVYDFKHLNGITESAKSSLVCLVTAFKDRVSYSCLAQIISLPHPQGLLNIFSRSGSVGFHSRAKPFELNFLYKKNFALGGQTRQSKSSSQLSCQFAQYVAGKETTVHLVTGTWRKCMHLVIGLHVRLCCLKFLYAVTGKFHSIFFS